MSSDLLVALAVLCLALAPAVRPALRKDGTVGPAVFLGLLAMVQFALLWTVYLGLRGPLREADLIVQIFALTGFGSMVWFSGKLIDRWKPIRLAREKMSAAQERHIRAAQAKHNTYKPMVLKDQ